MIFDELRKLEDIFSDLELIKKEGLEKTFYVVLSIRDVSGRSEPQQIKVFDDKKEKDDYVNMLKPEADYIRKEIYVITAKRIK